ncbi:MAG TPA: GHKL domain-containing protein [Bacillus bacterium]|nr:GHKL domain-containing protein [Bacillus sp. (in: firmicutes)]
MKSNVQTDNGYKKLGQFLRENENNFLNLWEKQIRVQHNKDKELIRQNGLLMYQLITKSIFHKFSENDIKLLAYKIAQERVDANINIGEFVYNVNLGRSIMINRINHSGILLEELQPVIDLINSQFDIFCYYAVLKYTELKDLKLQEKNLFITESHKDRLAILGQMSSSFVHEFRNPLTSVLGFVKLLKNEHPTLPYLDIISNELDQLKFRITQFLHTSKLNIISESKIREINIKELIEEMVDFLYPSIVDSNIQVYSRINATAEVSGDRNELKQVFLNLLSNAIDAVREEEIKQKRINIDAEVDFNHIKIKISNNGASINSDAIKLVFEPFYTTKKLGTGIGLFVCKNIVENHKGKIHCFSNEDVTTFQITLPLIQNE